MSRGGKRQGAGRPIGAKNKRKTFIAEKIARTGCEPIEGMARVANEALLSNDYALAGEMCKELAQYIARKQGYIKH